MPYILGHIFINDSMAKAEGKEIQKGSYRCSQCNNEFTGTACPECGNKKDNMELSADGLDKSLHTTASMFKGLRSTEATDADLLRAKAMQARIQEFDDNMGDAYVTRSEIKKKEEEIKKLKKEAEFNEMRAALESGKSIPSGPGAAPQNNMYDPGMNGMGGFPMFGAMSPQTVLMSKLMKMTGEERKEFLSSLEELDPQAVQNLSAMLAQPSPMTMPMGPAGMNGMYGIPPWMMQQMMMQQMMNGGHPQQQQQQPQADPTEVALSMMSTMLEFVQKVQPQRNDDNLKEYFKELKEELRAARQEKAAQPQSSELKPVLDELMTVKAQLAAVNQRKGLAETVGEIKSLIEGLEAVGLVKKPGSEGRSVDEELALKKFDFEKETKQKELEIQEKKIEADRDRSAMGKTLLAGMMQRAMAKRQEGEPAAGPAKRVSVASRPVEKSARAAPAAPPEIVESYKADAGIVMETRVPVKREG